MIVRNDPTPPAIFSANGSEHHYRKGYSHALHQALVAIEGGATLADLREWTRQVDEWRFGRIADHLPPSPIGGGR
jgi:hypothetical protein